MLVLMLLGGAADLASTEYGLSQGAYEANPLARNQAARIGINLAVPIIAYFALKDQPRAAKWFTIIYVGSKIGVVGRNFYVGAKLDWGKQ